MAAPNIPTQLQYQGGFPIGTPFDPSVSPPVFRAVVTDPDTSASSLRAFVRLFDNAGRFVWSREMTYTGGGNLFTYTSVYNASGNNHKFKVVFTGTPTGGWFLIGINGKDTERIGFLDTPSRKADIVGQHPDIGPGNVSCTWDAGTKTLTFECINNRAHMDLFDRLTVTTTGLIGTGTPKATISTVQHGQGDFPARQGQWFWDVVGYDNVQWSGGIGGSLAKMATGPAKAELWLDFPVSLASVSPADDGTVNSAMPYLGWSYTVGTILQVPIDHIDISIVDSLGTPVASYSLPPSTTLFRVPLSAGLLNGQTYTWTLDVYKQSGQLTSLTRTFTVSLYRPTAPTCTFSVASAGQYIGLNYSESELDPDDFIAYVAKVRPVGVAETSPLNVEVWSNALQSRTYGYVLRFPHNTPIILSFYVRQYSSGQIVDSQPREFSVTVPLPGVLLVNAITREYVALPTHRGRNQGPTTDPVLYPIWGQPAPIALRPRDRSSRIEFTATFEYGQAPAAFDALMAMYRNDRRTTIVYSDAQGYYGDYVLNHPTLYTPGGRGVQEIEVSLQEVLTNRLGEL